MGAADDAAGRRGSWYCPGVARGWESKAVEAQQDEAARGTPQGRDLSAEERALATTRRSLELAAAQAQAELTAACHRVHRDMLRQKLDAIHAALARAGRLAP